MRHLVLALALVAVSGSAFAGPTCTSEPKDKWLGEKAMKEKLAGLGYSFKVFKITAGNCYEIYGRNKSGQRIEVYFDPMTGDAVEEHKS